MKYIIWRLDSGFSALGMGVQTLALTFLHVWPWQMTSTSGGEIMSSLPLEDSPGMTQHWSNPRSPDTAPPATASHSTHFQNKGDHNWHLVCLQICSFVSQCKYLNPHCMACKTEAQKGAMFYPRPHSCQARESVSEPRLLWSCHMLLSVQEVCGPSHRD